MAAPATGEIALDRTAARMISADSHILERPDMWEKPLKARYGDAVPHCFDEFNGEKGRFWYSGRQVLRLGGEDSEHRGDELLRRAGYEPEARVEFQKKARVAAEVLYPTFGMVVMRAKDHAALKASAEVYNDWLREYFSYDPGRLWGVAIVPPVDVPWAVGELERSLANGFRSVMINCRNPEGMPRYRDPVYDPFWARAAEIGVPITLHPLTGQIPDPFHPETREQEGEAALWAIDQFNEIQGTLAADFIFGGILDRHPALKIVCSEFEISWLRYFSWRIDQLQVGLSKRMPVMAIALERASDYLRRNTWHGWIDDGWGADAIDVVTADRVMWGSDFPHVRSVALDAQSEVGAMLAGLPAADRHKILAANVAEVYRLN